MPEARNTHTAAPDAAHPNPSQTSASGDAPASPITLAGLGVLLGTSHAAYVAAERAWVCTKNDADKHAAGVATDRGDALQALAITMRPRNLADVVVQMGAAINIAYAIHTEELPQDQAEDRSEEILRVLLAGLPIVAEAAGNDMEALGWVYYDALAPRHLAGLAA